MKHIGTLICFLGLTATIGPRSADAAYTTLYSNTTTFSGYGYVGGGATEIGVNNTTRMFADDITPGAGLAGYTVNSVSFAITNFNPMTVTSSAEIYFYSSNPATGVPGTLLSTVTFAPIAFSGSGGTVVYTYTNATGIFTMPTGTFWAGITFSDNGGTTGATTAQLNNLGMGLFNAPTVGSSGDYFYQDTSATSNGTANPAGSLLYFGGAPVANFGWAFTGTAPAAAVVPEPGSLVLTSLAMAGFALRTRLRRRV